MPMRRAVRKAKMSPEDAQKNEQENCKEIEDLSDEEFDVTAGKQGFTEKEVTDSD